MKPLILNRRMGAIMLGTARRLQWQSPPAVATASLDIGFSKLKSPYVGILQLRHFQSQSHAELKDALQPAPQNVDRLQTPLDTGTLFVVKVPTLAKNINHGKIHEWHKSVGDHVEAGDLLCVIETEQLLVKVHSQIAGEIVETVGNEGCKVQTGSDLTIIRKELEEEDEME